MLKLTLKLTSIILVICFFVLTKRAYSADKVVGEIRAKVVEEIVRVDGRDSTLQLSREDLLASTGLVENKGHFYEGSVIYNMQSEPNSLITVHYRSVDNNSSLIRTERSIREITKIGIKSSSRQLVFDGKGNGELKLNPIFFIQDNGFYDTSDYKTIYYVTLFY